MNKNSVLLLAVWNVILTALLGWALLRKAPAPAAAGTPTAGKDSTAVQVAAPAMATDTAALKDARIAFLYMDSVIAHCDFIQDRDKELKQLGQSLQSGLVSKRGDLQQRYNTLVNKDHTYDTKAQQEADQKEMDNIQREMQALQGQSQQAQDRYDSKESEVTQEINDELKAFLEEYNQVHHFDYVFRLQSGDPTWVGNKSLNITADVVSGLNARHPGKAPAK